MSLKAFHIFFIAVSILFAFGFGIWILMKQPVEIESLNILCGLFSFTFGGGLLLYGIRFLKKFKHVSNM